MIACGLVRRLLYIVVSCVLLLAIAAVFVAPSVDLEPTAMRAARAATTAMAALVATATALIPFTLPVKKFTLTTVIPQNVSVSFRELVDIFCTRLC